MKTENPETNLNTKTQTKDDTDIRELNTIDMKKLKKSFASGLNFYKLVWIFLIGSFLGVVCDIRPVQPCVWRRGRLDNSLSLLAEKQTGFLDVPARRVYRRRKRICVQLVPGNLYRHCVMGLQQYVGQYQRTNLPAVCRNMGISRNGLDEISLSPCIKVR